MNAMNWLQNKFVVGGGLGLLVIEASITIYMAALLKSTVPGIIGVGTALAACIFVLLLVRGRSASEQAMAKERFLYRTLIDSLPDYLYVKDTESRMEIVNQAQVQLLGGKRTEDLLSKSDLDFFPKEYALKVHCRRASNHPLG